MSDPLGFPHDTSARVIWVFAIDLPGTEFQAFVTKTETGWPLADALGVPGLDPAHVETFPATDIAEYGLARYLTEAHDMSEASVAPDAGTLDALAHPVALIFSQALGGRQGAFAPRSPVRFVGRYEKIPTLSPAAPLPAYDSAKGALSGPAGPAGGAFAARRSLVLTLLALLALALLIWSLA